MEITLKQAFQIIDGRLSTSMDDVYKILDFVHGCSLNTLEIGYALKSLKKHNPEWYKTGAIIIEKIKADYSTNDAKKLIKIIDREYPNFKLKLEKIQQ